ncbi:MAG: hypothetical protein ANABAC_0072 [Anaerolineae bacterium]|nr:MAG: hypothetical protein ANABAC_0072 [Anaerolineae bacterium]
MFPSLIPFISGGSSGGQILRSRQEVFAWSVEHRVAENPPY